MSAKVQDGSQPFRVFVLNLIDMAILQTLSITRTFRVGTQFSLRMQSKSATLSNPNLVKITLLFQAGSVPLYAVLLIFTSHALCTAPIIAMSLAENFPTDIGPISIGITQASAFIFGAINIKLFPLMVTGSLIPQ